MRGRRAVAAVGLLVLAGCAGATSTPGDGALAAYLGEYAARMHAGDDARAVAAEEQIAACMRAEGFDYVPRPEGAWDSVLQVVPAQNGSLAWAQEHGYGLVDGAGTTQMTAAPDPNAAMIGAMSATERAAYDTALLGAAADDPDAPLDGCAAPADQKAMAWWDDATYEQFMAASTRIDEAVDDDARVTSAVTAWRTCVAERGHPELEAPGDGVRLMSEVLAPYQSDGSGSVPADVRTRLLAQEIALATAERGCDDEVGLRRTRDELIAAAQRAFVDEHAAELDAWELSWPAPSPSA